MTLTVAINTTLFPCVKWAQIKLPITSAKRALTSTAHTWLVAYAEDVLLLENISHKVIFSPHQRHNDLIGSEWPTVMHRYPDWHALEFWDEIAEMCGELNRLLFDPLQFPFLRVILIPQGKVHEHKGEGSVTYSECVFQITGGTCNHRELILDSCSQGPQFTLCK